jgi:hypothetical protein
VFGIVYTLLFVRPGIASIQYNKNFISRKDAKEQRRKGFLGVLIIFAPLREHLSASFFHSSSLQKKNELTFYKKTFAKPRVASNFRTTL